MKRNKDSNRVVICYIVNHRDDVLMGKRRDSGLWTNPGGHCLVGEDTFEGLVREVKEETGLDIQTAQLIRMGIVGENLLYMYKVTVDSKQAFDTSKDPDMEVETWEYVDLVRICQDLHIPKDKNWVLKYWANVL